MNGISELPNDSVIAAPNGMIPNACTMTGTSSAVTGIGNASVTHHRTVVTRTARVRIASRDNPPVAGMKYAPTRIARPIRKYTHL